MSDSTGSLPRSGIRDNLKRGSVGDFLKEKIKPGSKLSIVSAYFTIYAFEGLKERLLSIESLDFLFGEPRFIKALDPNKIDPKVFGIEDTGLALQNRLQQRQTAKECAGWIRDKVQIRSIKQANLLHGKMYHIVRGEVNEVIRRSRYERLMDDIIKAGQKTKVLLLSATPVNNDLPGSGD